MAAYIPVPRDLTRVKSKILFNLTKRQLLCFGAGALIGVPSFFLLKAGGNTSMASLSPPSALADLQAKKEKSEKEKSSKPKTKASQKKSKKQKKEESR